MDEINQKIRKGTARIYTASEVLDLLDDGLVHMRDVDVVTTATRAVMSGTYAVLSFPLRDKANFSRARAVTLNDVPTFVGPCPNERLGVLDLVVFGTANATKRYGGGHLFRDLVRGCEVSVEVLTSDGKSISSSITLDEIPHTKLFATRNCFLNYSAFINPGSETVSSIFHAKNFLPGLKELTFSGCGAINPIKNDPLLEAVGVGSRVLINGNQGFVTGAGTRSSKDRPNLSGFADMHGMREEYMGGFITSAGPECISSWAIPIPVLNQSIWSSVTKKDSELQLPLMDVAKREQIGLTSYGRVWDDVDLEVTLNPDGCIGCSSCDAADACPTSAILFKDGKPSIDRLSCFNCGLCTTTCIGDAFTADLGSVDVDGIRVPVVLRQSDRSRAMKMSEELKDMILEGRFKLSEPSEHIDL